ncbi:N-acetylmuramoyl-L-alanine amidase [Flammeovirga yaeyamensis]|uniref:N-acetylmuramoyl-L-alanine amidase n=1 Tax=Flammeovirga yaeyamensis TaxID=367791 RepID=A0AAX1NBC6_9BACT|nr:MULTISPECIES: N-acetylmuramoyl-L-alanine amidase [Flammeovirga]ANQ48932.1 N-acetylmuramoyl-L-alanine amidase [Flammeovirga sp. MY04]MBB3699017.1 N-acetylmuramoyl-L-alanine amidase [Flammeovirga yaeyamensis]NMF36451.1 N-acetylmuramoyl-L-alanine amidase [Flammeovirga yaeyamensis]QWG03590.1 N-acetylmuramoyl-L-alanine amidase [Flammeovirga yaeyamensis]
MLSLYKQKLTTLLLLFTLSLTQLPTLAQHRKFVIVIDPGHGGKDPGKPRGSKVHKHEKDLNLIIAKRIGMLIRNSMPDVQVYYTRTSDTYVSLEDRVKFAEHAKADYFLSIHNNSNPNKWIVGAKAHVDNNSDQISIAMAHSILNSIERNTLIQSRGIMNRSDRGYNLFVLKNTSMPSVLVECGFLSNPHERIYLNSYNGQKEVSEAIYKGFKTFHEKMNQKNGLYSIQILATNKKVPTTNTSIVKLLKAGLIVNENESIRNKSKIYKYTVGTVSTPQAAQRLKMKVRSLGFKDAFVVASPQ